MKTRFSIVLAAVCLSGTLAFGQAVITEQTTTAPVAPAVTQSTTTVTPVAPVAPVVTEKQTTTTTTEQERLSHHQQHELNEADRKHDKKVDKIINKD